MSQTYNGRLPCSLTRAMWKRTRTGSQRMSQIILHVVERLGGGRFFQKGGNWVRNVPRGITKRRQKSIIIQTPSTRERKDTRDPVVCLGHYKAAPSSAVSELWWLVLFIQHNLEFPGKRALNDRWFALGWPMGTSVRNCSEFIDVGRLIPKWAAPFPRQGILNWYKSREIKLSISKQVGMHEFISLSSHGCDMNSCLKSLPWLTDNDELQPGTAFGLGILSQ